MHIPDVLSAHVTSKVLCGAGLTNETVVQNHLGQDLTFSRDAEDNLYVNGQRVVTEDYVTENGVVHVINDVMSTSGK